MLKGWRAIRGGLGEQCFFWAPVWKTGGEKTGLCRQTVSTPKLQRVCSGEVRVSVLQESGLPCYLWSAGVSRVTVPVTVLELCQTRVIKHLGHQWEIHLGLGALGVHGTDLPLLLFGKALLQWNFITDSVSHHTYYITDWTASIYGCFHLLEGHFQLALKLMWLKWDIFLNDSN